jgi:SnoaL-like domain
MAVHTELTPAEAADRLALRELFDAYAHCADRRDAEGQKALFTDDTRFAVYMDGEGSEPTYVLQGREALTPVFDDLNRYEATTAPTWYFAARDLILDWSETRSLGTEEES